MRIEYQQFGEDADTKWQISVSDNGIGIAEEFAEKVFVIFQRLHVREAYSGTGIGLALCRKIVEYHGGEIWIDHEYTDGCRFCFTIPVSRNPNPRSMTLQKEPRYDRDRKTDRRTSGRRRPRR